MALRAGDRYVVGRHDAADIAFDDAAVSRLHGVLTPQDGGFRYEDYGSQNGSVIVRNNGDHVVVAPRQPVPVWAGDVLEVGGTVSRVCFHLALPEREQRRRDEGTEVSHAAREFAERLRLAGRTRVPVFLLGPSGSGKTHSARRLHELSKLPGAFVPLNCARLPTDPNALHSELLGHVRGAYTGADGVRVGKLVQADGGTLFLDEVESLPPVAQGFLLDVLEGTGDLAPLGAAQMRLKPISFRLISASKKTLASSGLRPDLCERLAEGHLWRVPSLRDRTDDIPGLMWRFCSEQSSLLGVEVVVTDAAIRFAQGASWPGEIRMLRATIVALAQLAVARHVDAGLGAGPLQIDQGELAAQLGEREAVYGGGDTAPVRGDARRLTRAMVEASVAAHAGNQVKAAQALGIARNTLRKKLAEH
jgi:DNA-binding NtrC family response regulator